MVILVYRSYHSVKNTFSHLPSLYDSSSELFSFARFDFLPELDSSLCLLLIFIKKLSLASVGSLEGSKTCSSLCIFPVNHRTAFDSFPKTLWICLCWWQRCFPIEKANTNTRNGLVGINGARAAESNIYQVGGWTESQKTTIIWYITQPGSRDSINYVKGI